MEINHALAYTTVAMHHLGYSNREIEKVTNKILEEDQSYSLDEVEGMADKILYDK
ncbi:hypothetical protein ACNRWW_11675 [Metabacillus sp. HB246100]|uniref:hypothetical protein n=1 Tax=Bacillus weihaiensis TaxID=1547283 RepID=UPI002355F9EA|nr:hypothetical protein [Bacillus weihaiensis]